MSQVVFKQDFGILGTVENLEEERDKRVPEGERSMIVMVLLPKLIYRNVKELLQFLKTRKRVKVEEVEWRHDKTKFISVGEVDVFCVGVDHELVASQLQQGPIVVAQRRVDFEVVLFLIEKEKVDQSFVHSDKFLVRVVVFS